MRWKSTTPWDASPREVINAQIEMKIQRSSARPSRAVNFPPPTARERWPPAPFSHPIRPGTRAPSPPLPLANP
jgi:hypothetical protein